MVVPWHPALVHFPIALAILTPAVAMGVWFQAHRAAPRVTCGLILVLLQLGVLVSGIVAFKTGEREEHEMAMIVPMEAVHEHEELAEHFLWAAGVSTVLSVGALIPGAVGGWIGIAYLAATTTTGVLVLPAGKSGGKLVYVHGAASAYTNQNRNMKSSED